MKKSLFVLIVILLPVSLFSQFTGSGTWQSPYTGGTLVSDLTWDPASDTIYVNGDLTVGNSGHLTIAAGIFIKFLSAGSDLIITGTGQLTADGTPSSKITFTADFDKDKIHGETGETWGHISFQSMGSAGASLFDNCVIEYCDVSGNSSPASYGGGIYADFSSITISNCKIQHNKAEWGGGVFVNQNRSPYITNCIFYNNFSEEGGGGIYCWNGSSPIIENSIFDSNHCDGTSATFYTGGGLASQSNCSITVNNCTFVNNTSSRTDGQSLMLYSSIADKAIDCIFWGSGSHFYISGTYTVNYCAVQGSAPSGTGNFVLNSSNTAPDGPNFTATDGTDWSINFISPCRDAGTTPSPAVPNDYIGNPRIGPYDIGAYEVLYSRWTGSTNTTWTTASNWDKNVDPISGTGDIIIPSGLTNYPTGDASQDFVINSGKYMTLNPGAKATFNSLRTNGTLKLESDATNISSLIISSYSGNSATVELFLTGGGNPNYKWHYISTPVSSIDTSVFTGVSKDLAQFVESRPSFGVEEGWVACDGYVYSTGTKIGPTFSTLTPGKGYNYYDAANQEFTFSGSLNIGNVGISLGYSGTPSLHGFNLLGNPFSSGLNWDDITNGTYFTYPSNTSKGLYFTRDNVQCTYIGGVSIPGDVTAIIPPMQGFFTKTYSTGNTITLPAAARTHDNIHARYKGETIIPLVRLSITENSKSDETVVRFDQQAKSYLDNDFDALKMFISATTTSIYSSMGGIKYAINGQPFPDISVEIPIVVNLLTSGNHTISAMQLQGLNNYNVSIKDNITGFTANLKTTPLLSFSTSAGSITDRFILIINNGTTGIEDPLKSGNTFNIYPANNFINIRTISDNWNGMQGSVKVLDLTGKTISDLQVAEFSKNSLIQVPAPMVNGIYIVELKSGAMRYVGKVVMR